MVLQQTLFERSVENEESTTMSLDLMALTRFQVLLLWEAVAIMIVEGTCARIEQSPKH